MATYGDSWKYYRWTYVVGRSLRFNLPSTSERVAADAFIAAMMPGRPWLVPTKQDKQAAGGTLNNDEYVGEMIASIGRDIKKTPLQSAAEVTYCNNLIAATGDRYLGDMGNIGSSDIG